MDSAGVRSIAAESAALKQRFFSENAELLVDVGRRMAECLRAGGKVLVFGNGGSAADAQHIAAEMVGRFAMDRAPLAAIALTTDTSALTAISNDYSFDRVFARQIEALGRHGDVALAISTSGGSKNVLAGVAAARRGGLKVVAFTGRDGGELGRAADVHVNVPENATARAQEVHRTLLHVLCELVEIEVSGL